MFYRQSYLGSAGDTNPLLHYLEHRQEPGIHPERPRDEPTIPREVRRNTQPGPFFEPVRPLPATVARRAQVLAYYLPQYHSVKQNDVYGPPQPCKVFRSTTTDPVLAVVYPALSRGNTPQALMVFADQRPDKWTSSSGSHHSMTFAEPGQTRFAIIFPVLCSTRHASEKASRARVIATLGCPSYPQDDARGR